MNKVKMIIWNREFDLPISYSCYPGEQVTKIQKDAVIDFCGKKRPVDCALEEVESYVLKTTEEDIKDKLDNIFRFVIPKSLYIPRSEEAIVAVLCNYKFDMEHGITIVFKNGEFQKIGTQDIIL